MVVCASNREPCALERIGRPDRADLAQKICELHHGERSVARSSTDPDRFGNVNALETEDEIEVF
jgi:hypothetical protein